MDVNSLADELEEFANHLGDKFSGQDIVTAWMIAHNILDAEEVKAKYAAEQKITYVTMPKSTAGGGVVN
jgi:hypothetical protein